MPAGKYNITIEKGSDYILPVQVMQGPAEALVPRPLTGYKARMQIRETYTSAASLVSLTSDPADGLTVNEAAGTIEIIVTAIKTTGLPLTLKKGVYDLEIYNTATGAVERVLKGKVKFDPEVTR